MHEPSPANTNLPTHADAKRAALLIGGASLLAVLMMAHHPTIQSRDLSGVAAELVRTATINQIVHGSLMALLFVQFCGLLEFTARVGLRHPLVRGGLVAYSLGLLGMLVAAAFSGFVVPDLGSRYLGGDAAALEALHQSMRLSHSINQAFAAIAVVARASAIMLWSIALWRLRGQWLLGVLGIVAAVPALALMAGLLQMDVHGAMLALLAEVVWYLAVATQLLRRRL